MVFSDVDRVRKRMIDVDFHVDVDVDVDVDVYHMVARGGK